MHPVIRIASFTVFTLSLAAGGKGQVLAAAVLLAVAYARVGTAGWPPAWRLLRRMRWLWLSLAVVYLWMTPGTPILPASPALAAWLPTVEGLVLGGVRLAALVGMAMAASLVLHLTPRDDVLAALYWLTAPLRVIDGVRERLAVRIALSLAAVEQVQVQLREVLAEPRMPASPWVRIGGVAAALFDRVTAAAEAAPCATLSLPDHPGPPKMQWAWPLLVGMSMWTAGRLIG
ncbi:MAG: hypothetical protein AABZ84_07890 [Pseudomonadota bacterium]